MNIVFILHIIGTSCSYIMNLRIKKILMRKNELNITLRSKAQVNIVVN